MPASSPPRLFYGRRKGRALKTQAAQRIATILPCLQIDISARSPVPPPQDWFAPQKYQDFALEIGFGGGEHLAHRAQMHPKTGFIGCELFINGIAKLLRKIDAAQLENIRIYDDMAQNLIAALPPACLAQVFLLYPDPWPKHAHHKRRFINALSLAQILTILKPGGKLLIASDSNDYIAWCLMHVAANPGFSWTAQTPDDWQCPPPDWQSTRYEMKARERGQHPTYLEFIKVAS